MQPHVAAATFSLAGDRDSSAWEGTIRRLVEPFEASLGDHPDAMQIATFERGWAAAVRDELSLFTYATRLWRDEALRQLLQVRFGLSPCRIFISATCDTEECIPIGQFMCRN